jgi:hypothetical protein
VTESERVSEEEAKDVNDRREFLKKCGRFAAVTPPAMTLLLSVSSVPREAHASTIGHHPPGGPPPRPPLWPPFLPWPL